MSTPDLTKAQILAVVQATVAAIVAFGVSLDQTQQVALLALAGAVASLLITADAALRRARAKHIAGPQLDLEFTRAIAAAHAAAAPSTTDPVRAATTTLAKEAAADTAAQAANDQAAPPGRRPRDTRQLEPVRSPR